MKELEKSQLKYLESDEFKKAQKIAQMSIKKHLELFDKAEKYDRLEPILFEMIEDFRNDKSLGSYEITLCEQVESIITSVKRIPEETQ